MKFLYTCDNPACGAQISYTKPLTACIMCGSSPLRPGGTVPNAPTPDPNSLTDRDDLDVDQTPTANAAGITIDKILNGRYSRCNVVRRTNPIQERTELCRI